ncbi:MAG: hypothetical protein IKS07_04040 [Lachnospiraceae bacterium]|nr:hypothetical protein [Lachnospiraceae bacterium]MCR5478008.1 hypothetical protein [Lachnospiraceae bacterium]
MNTGVIYARCTATKKDFGIALQQEQGGDWCVMRAYPLGPSGKKNGGDEDVDYRGGLKLSSDYNGCPHCQSGREVIRCGSCGKFGCYDGSGRWTCPHCGHVSSQIGSGIKDFKGSGGQ